MEFQPDYSKLASAKLPPEELQAAFIAMLMNAAAIDCGSVIDPDVRHAEERHQRLDRYSLSGCLI